MKTKLNTEQNKGDFLKLGNHIFIFQNRKNEIAS